MNEYPVTLNGGSPFVTRLHGLVHTRSYLLVGQAALHHVLARALPSITDNFTGAALVNVRRSRSAVNNKKLEGVLIRSNEILAHATSVFPMTLFPDTIVLDRTKLTVIRRSFIFSEDVMSIRIEDILNVSATMGPIFGSITIATRVLSSDDHFTIRNFWREDALHLKHMIQGYVIARHNNIATDHLPCRELKQTLRELGYEANRFRHSPQHFRAL